MKITGKIWSLTPIRLTRVFRNGAVWKDLPVPSRSSELSFQETAEANEPAWFSLVVEADELPPAPASVFAQAVTGAVRVYVGDGKIRNRDSAEYFLKWIEKLRAQTAGLSLWRTAAERERAYRDLDAAAEVYRARAAEARR